MNLVYKPFGIVLGVLAGVLSRRLFAIVWSWFDPQDAPPAPTAPDVTVRKAVGAAALEGAVFAATRAAVDRAGARGFWNLTGIWPDPGKTKAQKKLEKAEAKAAEERAADAAAI